MITAKNMNSSSSANSDSAPEKLSPHEQLGEPHGFVRLLPWLALIVSLFLTHQLWQHERASSLEKLQSDFDFQAREATTFILKRMRIHEQTLRGFRGLFAVHRHVGREEFHNYVESLQLENDYPGIQYVFFVAAPAVRQTEPSPAAKYGTDLSARLAGGTITRLENADIAFVEALNSARQDKRDYAAYFSARNQLAMDRARDTGAMALSESVALAARPSGEAASGFSLHLPIYQGGKVPATLHERRVNLVGWITLSFDMKPLMESVLNVPFSVLDVHLLDGEGATDEPMIYDSLAQSPERYSQAFLRNRSRLEIGGHTWTVAVNSTPAYEARLDERSAYVIGTVGMIVSPLLFLVIWLLIHGRALAMRQASSMTQQLELSERRYRLMFEDNASMSCLIDRASGRFVDVNPAAAAFWGYSREELLGMSIFDINVRQREAIRQTLDQLVDVASPMRFETRHRLKNGEIRDVEVFAGLLDYNGVPIFHATFHDIGNRREIELNLVRALVDASPFSVLTIDGDGCIHDANQSAATVFRCRREELIGTNVANLVPESISTRHFDRLAVYSRNPFPLEVDESIGILALRHDGEEFPVEVRLTPIQAGGQTFIIVSIHDITERRRTGNALRKLERAVEQTPVSIVITGLSGDIEYVNPIFSEVTGYSREEAIGQNPRIMQSGETPVEIYQNLWKTITSGGVWKGEVRNRKKNGELFWEEATISPVINEAGEITNFIAVKEDITQRKQIETDLKLAKEAAEAANNAKGEFLAMMSHEIRTPLNGVIGLTSLLLDTRLDKEQKEFAETVKQSADSLLFVINDILDFSKIEAGRLDVEVIDFDLRALIENMNGMLAYRAREKELDFISQIWPDVPSLLRGDPGRLRQVLLNLVSNALKFTERGQVALHVDLVEELGERSRLRFEVRDTGIGISADKLDKLFTPFTQVDASTTRRYGGTGLGLAISKQLVELMDGEIGVDSHIGSGSIFWFCIPFERQRVSVHLPTAALVDLSGKRVLVVDGHGNYRTIQDHLLNDWHCGVAFVDNAVEACALLRTEQRAGRAIDAVIVNTLAADQDCAHFAGEIKADPTLARMPLVLMSSTPQRGEARRMKEAGFDAYLTRAASGDLLFRCLVQVMENAKGIETAPRPFVTQHTLAESERRASILLVAAQPEGIECPDCRKLMQDLHEKLGHRIEMANDGYSAMEALSHGRFDLVLLDGQSSLRDVHDTARLIRAGMTTLPDCDVPLVALLGQAVGNAEEVRAHALAAGLNDTLSKPVDAFKLDHLIQQVLHKGIDVAPTIPPEATDISNVVVGRHLRLLLAEDNPVNQKVALGLLRKLGIEDVVCVDNGQKAIDAVSESNSAFDLILMDCQMPVLDGFSATHTLRDMGCRTPIIAITAHALSGVQEQCYAAGMNGYISKPIDPDEFARVLTRCLSTMPNSALVTASSASSLANGPRMSFDRSAALERLVGDAALLDELIRIFIGNWPASLRKIEEAIDRGDVENATRECHTVKGSSLTIGAALVGSIAGAMTEAGKRGEWQELRRLLPDLVSEVARFCEAAVPIV